MLGYSIGMSIDTAPLFVVWVKILNSFRWRSLWAIIDTLTATAGSNNLSKRRFEIRSLKNFSHLGGAGEQQAFNLMHLDVGDKAPGVEIIANRLGDSFCDGRLKDFRDMLGIPPLCIA